MYCERCGNELREGARFCSHCGGPVALPPAAAVKHDPSVGKQIRRMIRYSGMSEKEAIAKLASMGPSVIGPIADEYLTSDNATHRIVAILYLGFTKNPAALDILCRALRTDADPEIRQRATYAIGLIQSAHSTRIGIDALIEALSDPEPRVRAEATAALGHVNDDPRVVDALIQALSDRTIFPKPPSSLAEHFVGFSNKMLSMRAFTEQALRNIGDRRGIEALVKMHKGKALLKAAEEFGLEETRAVQLLAKDLEDEDEKVRKQAAQVLGDTRHETAFEPLVQALGDESSSVRCQVVKAIAKTKDTRAIGPLVQMLLEDESDDVRCQVTQALDKMKDPRAVDPLIRALLEDRYDSVRQSAACALGTIGDERALEALSQATKDKSWFVRSAAKSAMRSIKANLST